MGDNGEWKLKEEVRVEDLFAKDFIHKVAEKQEGRLLLKQFPAPSNFSEVYHDRQACLEQ
jgi:hypothetical protein